MGTTKAYTHTYGYDLLGNLTSQAGVTQSYSGTQPHAVTSRSGGGTTGSFFQYDANGNMTLRVEVSGSQRITYTQGWDIENRLVAVTNMVNGQVTQFWYDADGQRAKRVDVSGTVAYIGPHFEMQVETWTATSYYHFGGQRVAMRVVPAAGPSQQKVYWLHGDHLGSASLTTDAVGNPKAEQRYYPFGETRWVSGTLPTDRRFTGQLELAGLGIYDYGARAYSPLLGRFLSADTIVPQPGSPQTLNRYSYSLNNPVKYSDPTGHCPQPPENIGSGNIICIAGFIPVEVSQALLAQYLGDNRDFTPFGSTDESSRVWVWIDVATGRFVDPDTGKPTDIAKFHFTMTADGKEKYGPLPTNQFNSERDKNGNIVVKYSFQCSAGGFPGGINCSAGPAGTITFKPNQFGSFDTEGDVTRFPNLEAYHWKNGEYQATLFQIRAFSKQEEQEGYGTFWTGSAMIRQDHIQWKHSMQQANDALSVTYPEPPDWRQWYYR